MSYAGCRYGTSAPVAASLTPHRNTEKFIAISCSLTAETSGRENTTAPAGGCGDDGRDCSSSGAAARSSSLDCGFVEMRESSIAAGAVTAAVAVWVLDMVEWGLV